MAALSAPSFGALLRHHRLAAGLTQEELAERAGVSPRAISALELGERRKPYRQTLALLAVGLELSPQDTELLQRAAGYLPVAPEHLARDASLSVPPLVGRSDELATIERFLSGPAPAVLMVAGEPGIGKSRLLREAARMSRGAGYTVLPGGGQRRSGLEPYAPLLDTLSRSLPGLSAAQLRSALAGCGWLTRLLPELAELARVPVPAGTLAPDQERRLVFGAVARYLANIAGPGGTLLLLDDLQWSSPDGLDLLASLLQKADANTVRVIGAYRQTEVGPDHPLSALLAELAEQELVEQLPLSPLDEADALSVLDRLLQSRDAVDDQTVKQRIVKRAGGVPFFLVSCVHGLEAGEPGVGVPWTVTQSIRQRVAVLPKTAQDVLQAAAILGRLSKRSTLLRMVASPEDEASAALDAACRARLLFLHGRSNYGFAHDVVREAIEADLGDAQRVFLHRKAAEVLEALLQRGRGADGTRQAAELAWHFMEGDDLETASRYAVLAGDQAAAIFAHEEAERQYRTAAHLAHEVHDRTCKAEALEKLGQVLVTTGRYDEAIRVLQDAAGMLAERGEVEALGRLEASIGSALHRRGATGEAISRLWAALDGLPDAHPSEAHFDLFEVLATCLAAAGRGDEALTMAEEASTVARSLGDVSREVRAEGRRGFILCTLGRDEEALPILEGVVEEAERRGDLETLYSALNNAAHIYDASREHDAFQRTVMRQLKIAERVRDPYGRARALASLGHHIWVRGDWPTALGYLEQAAALVRGLPSSINWLLTAPACVLVPTAADESARHYLEECVNTAQQRDDAALLAEAHVWLAEHELASGHADVARVRLEPLLAHPRWDVGTFEGVVRAYAQAILETSGATDDLVRVQRLLSEVVAWARSARVCYVLVEAFGLEGWLHARLGDAEAAMSCFEEALGLARGLPFPFGEARVLYACGMAQVEQGEREAGRRHLEEAAAIFYRLGARLYADRVQQVLAGGRVSSKHGSV